MEYRPQQKARFASIEAGKAIEDTRERLRMLTAPVLEGKEGDKAQKFIWGLLSEMCLYAARRMPEISESIVDVDRAMRWGFGWELGPFETWDAIGVGPWPSSWKRKGNALPPVVTAIACVRKEIVLRIDEGRNFLFRPCLQGFKPVPVPEGIMVLKSLKERSKEIEKNSGASLIDLGDGVVCCEFHSKMNAIGGDLLSMIHKGSRGCARISTPW